jgi:hypothetical protein
MRPTHRPVRNPPGRGAEETGSHDDDRLSGVNATAHPCERPFATVPVHDDEGDPMTEPGGRRLGRRARKSLPWRPPYPPWGVGPWPVRHPVPPTRRPALAAALRRRRAMTDQWESDR